MRTTLRSMGRHRGGRGFQGFHSGGGGGHDGFGHHGRVRGRKVGSDDLQLLLLLLLEEQPRHGYELIKALELRSSGFYSPSPGMVYPALTYLEELGYLTAKSQNARKHYQLGAPGRAYLDQHRAAAQAVMRQLEQFGRSMFSLEAAPTPTAASPITPRHALSLGFNADAVLTRLREEAEQNRPADGGPHRSGIHDPFHYADYGFSISQEQGELIYLLCRQMRAQRVVDFATSVGVSAIYFAAAMRDNQGGLVFGTEIVPEKIRAAEQNLTMAGLEHWVQIHRGDARNTLKGISEPVDFALIDGWPGDGERSLAREVVEILAPPLRSGGLLMNDNAEPDYLDYVRDPKNGFVSITLPLKGGTELSLKS
jgi:predicted O-methyltransferase YrrM/DNA-binding PadR family transcriptional regulator